MFETRKEGELILIFAKKKIVQEREDWECPLSSKNNKKEYFREHFRASEFKHTLFSKCYYYHKTTSSIARRA